VKEEIPLHIQSLKIDSNLWSLVRRLRDKDLKWSLIVNIPGWPKSASGQVMTDAIVENKDVTRAGRVA